jgi:hypothetical protein
VKLRLMAFLAALAIVGVPASAGTLTQQLGVQAFNSGDIVTSGAFIAAADTGIFNTIIGADNNSIGPNFSASWNFSSYGPVVDPVVGASLLIASWDFDTNNTGLSHVLSFDMNGTDLTAILDAAFKANPNTNALGTSQILWYTIDLPSSTFAQLATGSATFNLTLQNGRGILGTTTFNSGGMDFSTLNVDTQAQQTVPEPSTVFAMIGGLAAVAALRRKRTAA